AGLPDLGEIDLVLLASPRPVSQATAALTAAILGSGHPIPPRPRCPGRPPDSSGHAVREHVPAALPHRRQLLRAEPAHLLLAPPLQRRDLLGAQRGHRLGPLPGQLLELLLGEFLRHGGRPLDELDELADGWRSRVPARRPVRDDPPQRVAELPQGGQLFLRLPQLPPQQATRIGAGPVRSLADLTQWKPAAGRHDDLAE